MEDIILDKVRLSNYATMIKNINRVIGRCSDTNQKIDDKIDDLINKADRRSLGFGILNILNVRSDADTPLQFIYGNPNIYAELIMCITQYSFTTSGWWENTSENTDDRIYEFTESTYKYAKNIDTARKFVKHFKESENVAERYQFIFWALMILTVDKTNAEGHLSLICDYAEMLGITDDEFEDIIRTIKIIYNQEKSCSFKTETILDYFSKLFELMKINVD